MYFLATNQQLFKHILCTGQISFPIFYERVFYALNIPIIYMDFWALQPLTNMTRLTSITTKRFQSQETTHTKKTDGSHCKTEQTKVLDSLNFYIKGISCYNYKTIILRPTPPSPPIEPLTFVWLSIKSKAADTVIHNNTEITVKDRMYRITCMRTYRMLIQ